MVSPDSQLLFFLLSKIFSWASEGQEMDNLCFFGDQFYPLAEVREWLTDTPCLQLAPPSQSSWPGLAGAESSSVSRKEELVVKSRPYAVPK